MPLYLETEWYGNIIWIAHGCVLTFGDSGREISFGLHINIQTVLMFGD